jgi:glycosyltransferase involved in cell wall biosynthesis
VIEAMPAVVRAVPDACYVILGATHPQLVLTEGERYRTRLLGLVADLDMAEHVLFVDRFVGQQELARWLEAADVFVTPYPNLDQIVSGTLSYAMAAGKASVSTPYLYASEILADGRGRAGARANVRCDEQRAHRTAAGP